MSKVTHVSSLLLEPLSLLAPLLATQLLATQLRKDDSHRVSLRTHVSSLLPETLTSMPPPMLAPVAPSPTNYRVPLLTDASPQLLVLMTPIPTSLQAPYLANYLMLMLSMTYRVPLMTHRYSLLLATLFSLLAHHRKNYRLLHNPRNHRCVQV